MKLLKHFNRKDAASYKKFVLFTRFILSYLIILMIPLFFIGVFIYRNFSDVLYKEVQNTTLAALSQTLDTMEMRLKEFNNIAIQLPQNYNISPLFSAEGANRLSEYEYYRTREELRGFRSVNVFIDGIYLYFRKSDIIVGADSKYNLSIFYNQVFKPAGMSEQDVKHLLENVSEQQVRAVNIGQSGNNANGEKLVYLKPMPVADTTYKATMLIVMDTQYMNRLFKNILGNYSGSMYILDEKGNIVNSLHEGNAPIEQKELLTLLGPENGAVYSREINGKKMILSYIKSEYSGWCCMAILDPAHILAPVNSMRGWVLAITLLCVSIGIVLAYYFSYSNYHPIRKVAELLYTHSGGSRELRNGYKNELDMIEKVMSSILSEDKTLQDSLKQYKPVVRAEFLLRILKGDFGNLKSIDEMAEFVGLKLSSGPFAVMVFSIDDASTLEQENTGPVQGLYRFSIANVASELCSAAAQGHTVDIGSDRVAMIIDFEEGAGNHGEEMRSIGERALEFLQKNFEFTMTVGVGGVYHALMDVSKSFMEAQSAVEYKMVRGSNHVIMYDSIVTGSEERYFYSLQHEQRILDCLKQGNFEEVHQVLDSIINKITATPISMSMAQCIYFEIVNTAMKSLTELEPEDYNEIMRNNNILPDLLKCKTLKEVYGQTVNFYRAICEYIRKNRECEESGFQQEVILYVKNNYCDGNLSLMYLADRFSVSQSYLSRFFKNNTQMNFIDYLHTLRLAKAKQLLKGSGKSIVDIAEECGYTDSHSLIRVFRKYEGITPGRFREMYNGTHREKTT